jgi:hypothetical protein
MKTVHHSEYHSQYRHTRVDLGPATFNWTAESVAQWLAKAPAPYCRYSVVDVEADQDNEGCGEIVVDTGVKMIVLSVD